MLTRRPTTLVSERLAEWPTVGCVAPRDAAALFGLSSFFGFLFQVLLLIQKLESLPGQKADLAAGGYPCVKGEAGRDC